jgi:hypothetical protein
MILRHMPQTYTTLIIILFYLLSAASQAAPGNTQQEPEQQQLQSILQELEQASKQRQQHNTRVDKLSRQLECNWTLIRAYEVCGQLHKNDPKEHLKCSTTAKQNAARCLENVGGK